MVGNNSCAEGEYTNTSPTAPPPILLRQFHDGLGFLVSHALISNTFEFSLQVVNPKLALPYWDFTIETSSSADPVYDRNVPYTRTPLLQPSWFGTYDPEDHMVRARRWEVCGWVGNIQFPREMR